MILVDRKVEKVINIFSTYFALKMKKEVYKVVVKLYTTGCPKCKIIETKLNTKGIEFEKIEDFDVEFLINKGFTMAPVIEVDGEFMGFVEANKWVNNK